MQVSQTNNNRGDVNNIVRSAKCLTKLCKDSAAADLKGLCMKCYSSAKKMVEAGKTTWEELEQMGLCVSKRPTPLEEEFARLKNIAG